MKITKYEDNRRAAFSGDKATLLETRASSIYQELIEEGCIPNDIISLSTHLISLVTTDLKKE